MPWKKWFIKMSKIDELTIFEIVPYIGTNMVNFGATRAEVCDSMGAAERTSISFQGKLIEYRSYMNVAYTGKEDGVVDHIGFGRQMINVHLSGVKIFQAKSMDVLRELSKIDPEPKEFMNSIVFMKLGISLAGFLDDEDDDKAMAVFIRGKWDPKLPRMSSVHF
jgi:hypothetical protein